MNQFRQDIEDFAKIWDKALENGVFNDLPKPAKAVDVGEDGGTDFFGQRLNGEYNIDTPMNESDVKAWCELAKNAAERSPYFNPVNEEREYSKPEAEKLAKKTASSFNPVYPNTIGKDQDLKVVKNWALGGEELTKLEDLKKRLHALEVKLNSLGVNKPAKDKDDSTLQKSIDDLKQQVDDLSDRLNGNNSDAN